MLGCAAGAESSPRTDCPPTCRAHVAIIMDGNGRWAARARTAARRRAPPRRRGAAQDGARGRRHGHPLPDHLLVLVGELAAAGLRSARPDGAAAPVHPQGPRRAARQRRARARDRRARQSRSGHPPPARRSRGADPREHQPVAGRRVQLRRTRRDRARGAPHRREMSRAAR